MPEFAEPITLIHVDGVRIFSSTRQIERYYDLVRGSFKMSGDCLGTMAR